LGKGAVGGGGKISKVDDAAGVALDNKVTIQYSDKIIQQMKKRGWTEADIERTLSTKGISTIGKKGTATRYVDPKTGKSLVVDDTTGEIFHVGKVGYKYDY
jgi:predicted RNA binding protein YcfA (HicA-like mRNA interferase family)